MVELVDTTDLKSVDPNGSCGFKSRSGYHGSLATAKHVDLTIDAVLPCHAQVDWGGATLSMRERKPVKWLSLRTFALNQALNPCIHPCIA